MSTSRFRKHRQDGRAPAFAGDFPDDDRDVTEIFDPRDSWDDPAAQYRQAIAEANVETGNPPGSGYHSGIGPGNVVWHPGQYPPGNPESSEPPGTARTRPPDMFPALPPALQPHARTDPRDTGPQQRLPRYARTAARPRPQRAPDAAIFVWVPSISQHVLLCGMCLWRRHADPITASMPFTFESLRQSAWITGWRTDAFTRWCCPHCKDTPAYWTPRPVILWDGDAVDAYLAGDADAETWRRARAERHLICDVADASHGRHAAVTR